MLFLTYEKFSVVTHITPNQVRQILSNQIENDETSLVWTSQTTDTSTAEEYKFDTISRNYRRYRATIDGKVVCENGSTKIDIIVRPQFSSILITVIILSLLILLGLSLILAGFGTPSLYVSKDSFVILGALILGYIVVIGVFRFEVMLTKRWLKTIFQTEDI